MDARIDPVRILGLEPGDAHVIRNAGGVVNEDALASLAVSQRLLGTEQIKVIQHTDCGMAELSPEALEKEIERDTGQRPPFALEAIPDPETGVRDAVARIEASAFLPYREDVSGYVYDVTTGHLHEVAGIG